MTEEDKKKAAKKKAASQINNRRFEGQQRPYETAETGEQAYQNMNSNRGEQKRLLSGKQDFAADIDARADSGAFAGDEGQASMYERGTSLGLSREQVDKYINKGGQGTEAPQGAQAPAESQGMRVGTDRLGPNRLQGASRGPGLSAFGQNSSLAKGGGFQATGETNGPGGARGLTSGSEFNQIYSQAERDKAKSMRKQSRAYNLAYRQKIREGDREGALGILNDAGDRGVSFGGIRSAGFFEQQAKTDSYNGMVNRGKIKGALDDPDKDNKL